MINSSAGIQPHCLSTEFCTLSTKHRIIIFMCFFTSLQKHGKNFFHDLIILAKSFYGGGIMSYDILIEQIRTLPEQLLMSVSVFIKFLQSEQNSVLTRHTEVKSKQAFFDLAGKIQLDCNAVTELREKSLV